MSSSYQGRHERGQNFLCDSRVVADIVKIVSHTTGSIVEVGAGDGALTVPMERLGRPLTAIEIDRRRAIIKSVLDHAVIAPGPPGSRKLDTNRVQPQWRI